MYPTFATWLNGAKVVRYNSASGPKRLSAFYWFQARTSLFKSYLEKDQRCRRPYTLWGENTDFSVHRDYESWLTLEGGKSK